MNSVMTDIFPHKPIKRETKLHYKTELMAIWKKQSKQLMERHVTLARSCCRQTYFQQHAWKCFRLNLHLHSVFIFLLCLTLRHKAKTHQSSHITDAEIRSLTVCWGLDHKHCGLSMVLDLHILNISASVFQFRIRWSLWRKKPQLAGTKEQFAKLYVRYYNCISMLSLLGDSVRSDLGAQQH